MQVCYWDFLQVSTEARVDWKEFCLLGALPLQQHVGGAAQQQRNPHRARASPAAGRDSAGLRQRLPCLL